MLPYTIITDPKTELKIIQAAIKAYGLKELLYDAYSDRLNFIGSNVFPLRTYLENRGIIFDADRAGYSISIADAKRLGLPTDVREGYYTIFADARKAIK